MSDYSVNAAMSGHQFYRHVQACLAEKSNPDEELTRITQAFVDANCTSQNAESMNVAGESFSDWA